MPLLWCDQGTYGVKTDFWSGLDVDPLNSKEQNCRLPRCVKITLQRIISFRPECYAVKLSRFDIKQHPYNPPFKLLDNVILENKGQERRLNLWNHNIVKPGLCQYLADLWCRSRRHASFGTSANCLWRHRMLFLSCSVKGPQMKWKYWLCAIGVQHQGYISRVNCHLNSLRSTQ